jgi:uridine kinase
MFMVYVVGVSGISGGGKSTFVNVVEKYFLQPAGISTDGLKTDDAYLNLKENGWSREDRDNLCFGLDNGLSWDHPDMITFAKLKERLRKAKTGEAFSFPPYNFDDHSYSGLDPVQVPGELDVIFMEGIFALRPELLEFYDLTVFVDAPEGIAFARRVVRDTQKPPEGRGRRIIDVYDQYTQTVHPCQERFILPTADAAQHRVRWYVPRTKNAEDLKGGYARKAHSFANIIFRAIRDGKDLPMPNLEDIVIPGVDS